MHFKIPIGVAFGLLVNKENTFSNPRTRQEPGQYVRVIMQHTTGANILGVSN